MSSSLLILRLALAAVFAVAGIAKLLDLSGARAALAGFGVPERLARPAAVTLPLAEIAIAAGLLPEASARFAATAGAILLAVFVLAIGRSIARGEAPDCHCFGQLHSAPAGWPTLARNLLLVAAAGFVAIGGWHNAGPDALAWIGRLNEAERIGIACGVALTLVTGAGAAFMLALLRQQGRLLVRIDDLEEHLAASGVPLPAWTSDEPDYGLPVGTGAPDFKLSGLYGETVTLESLRAADQPVMLVFTDPACGPCNALLPEVARWQRELASELTLAVITRGTVDDNRAKIREHAVSGVWLDPDLAVYEAYEAPGTPAAVIIDAEGRIASPVAAGVEAVTGLINRAQGRPFPIVQSQPQAPQPPPAGPPVGAPAPLVELSDLGGERVVLSAEDRDTLVLFWDPACGFCQRMLSDLRAWEDAASHDGPRLVVISRGSVDENEAMGLQAPVVLDGKLETNTMFGTMATPSAVLVDSSGRVASELALGVSAVMALANGRSLDAQD